MQLSTTNILWVILEATTFARLHQSCVYDTGRMQEYLNVW